MNVKHLATATWIVALILTSNAASARAQSVSDQPPTAEATLPRNDGVEVNVHLTQGSAAPQLWLASLNPVADLRLVPDQAYRPACVAPCTLRLETGPYIFALQRPSLVGANERTILNIDGTSDIEVNVIEHTVERRWALGLALSFPVILVGGLVPMFIDDVSPWTKVGIAITGISLTFLTAGVAAILALLYRHDTEEVNLVPRRPL